MLLRPSVPSVLLQWETTASKINSPPTHNSRRTSSHPEMILTESHCVGSGKALWTFMCLSSLGISSSRILVPTVNGSAERTIHYSDTCLLLRILRLVNPTWNFVVCCCSLCWSCEGGRCEER